MASAGLTGKRTLARQRLKEKVAEAKKKDASASKSHRGKAAPTLKKGCRTSENERIKELETLLAKANKQLQERDKQLADKENQPSAKLPQLITKPKGSARDGFILIDAMGLKDNQGLYDAVLRKVRENAIGVGLDWTKDFRSQEAVLLGRAYKLGRDRFPFLSKFVNDWPQAEIIRQWFANRRRHAVRQGYLPKREDQLNDAAAAGCVALTDGETRKKQRNQQTQEDDEDNEERDGQGSQETDKEDDEGDEE